MKTCKNCQIEKPFSDFRTSDLGRYIAFCRPCDNKRRTVYNQVKRATNPEWVEKERLRNKRRYARDKSKPTFIERERKRVQRQREGKPYRIRSMFYSTKSSAAKRGIPFLLSKSDIAVQVELQAWTCARTGLSFDLRSFGGQLPFGPSVDRIDSNRGYEPGNIEIVCYMYNCAKNRFTHEDVLTFAQALVSVDQKQTIKRAA